MATTNLKASDFMQDNILVVEDSPVVQKVLQHLLQQKANMNPIICGSYEEAKEVLESGIEFFACVADLHLPDAENGEVVDLILSYKLSCIVLTGLFDEKLRSQLLAKGVVDYITKDTRFSFSLVIKLIERLQKNTLIKVLVAEDSATSRVFINHLLKQYHFQVVNAENGQEALARLEEDPTIRLLLTDFNMPELDGYELVRLLRHNQRFNDLVIIGLSAEGDNTLTAKFIKSGANDFLKKPFYHEEFHCRVIRTLEAQEMLEEIRDFDKRDPLTKLFNRRYLFDEGEAIYQRLLQHACPVVVLIDLFQIKGVNKAHGVLVGDAMLQEFAGLLRKFWGDNAICARLSGESFVIVLNMTEQGSLANMQQVVAEFVTGVRATLFTEAQITLGPIAGGVSGIKSSLEEAIGEAESQVSQAKRKRLSALNANV